MSTTFRVPSIRVGFYLVIGLAAISCSDNNGGILDPEPITAADLVGSYTATEFTLSSGGDETDVLDAGGVLTLSLNANGTTTGRLFIPESVAGEEGALDADLTGTFTFDEQEATITFEHASDTFLRDTTFLVVSNEGIIELRGNEAFSGVNIEVVLTQQ